MSVTIKPLPDSGHDPKHSTFGPFATVEAAKAFLAEGFEASNATHEVATGE